MAPREDTVVVFHSISATVLDLTGSGIIRYGGDGEGPGEFRQVTRVGRTPSGEAWVWDQRLHRYSEIDIQDGRIRQSSPWLHGADASDVQFAMAGLIGSPRPGSWLAIGTLRSPLSEPKLGGAAQSRVIARLDSAGRYRGVLVSVPRTIDCSSSFGPVVVAIPECQSSMWAVAPDASSIVVAWSEGETSEPGTIRVVRVLEAGDTIYTRAIRLPTEPFTQEMQDSVFRSRSPDYPPELRARGSVALHAPSTLRAVNDLLVGADGTLWLKGILSAEGRQWAILDADGKPCGLLRLDDELLVAEVSGRGALAARDLMDGGIEVLRIRFDGC